MARFAPGDIRRFYDRNTAAFVALGQGGGVGAIHRAVWGPGVHTREQAFRYAEDRIADHIRRLPLEVEAPHVVDLGCGVGASICYLADLLPTITATGITISPVQAQLARERIARAGLSARATCLEGDFAHLPDLRPADLAYAIEAFVHAPSAEQFFEQCRALVRPEGVLILCDDFKRGRAAAPGAAPAVEQFRRGWHINTLLTTDELCEVASQAGFEHHSTTDWTHYLELNRPRDRVVSALAPLVGWLPLQATRVGHLLGGSALQKCLDRRWIGYDFVVLQRVAG
jgi:tocopherol O-methyltransferase